jgi:hypothetical protein
MKRRIKKLLSKKSRVQAEESQQEGVPRITNETVAEHREAVLSQARKYIYPLQHSKHKIVLISTSLFLASIVIFFAYSVLALYKFHSNSTFMYRVTQVVPFPVARTGSRFIAYENYLFELRHYIHYYESQQKVDFTSESGQQQLEDFKRRALDKVVNDAIIKQLAEQHKVSVSDREVDDTITLLRNQNRLGGSDQVFEDVLKDNWGWSVNDFKRTLKQQLLMQKVLAAVDTETSQRAKDAHDKLKAGTDFAELAKSVSDDPATKPLGGDFGFAVDKTNRDFSPQTIDALYRLQPGQFSEVLNISYALEIVKNVGLEGDKVHGAHMTFNFKDVNTYINELKDKQKVRLYLRLPPPSEQPVQTDGSIDN